MPNLTAKLLDNFTDDAIASYLDVTNISLNWTILSLMYCRGLSHEMLLNLAVLLSSWLVGTVSRSMPDSVLSASRSMPNSLLSASQSMSDTKIVRTKRIAGAKTLPNKYPWQVRNGHIQIS